jgi:hypothetical protein
LLTQLQQQQQRSNNIAAPVPYFSTQQAAPTASIASLFPPSLMQTPLMTSSLLQNYQRLMQQTVTQNVPELHNDSSEDMKDGNDTADTKGEKMDIDDAHSNAASQQNVGDYRPLRSRSFLNDAKVQLLHAQFRRNAFPSKYELSALAEQIDVKKRVVQVWFQVRNVHLTPSYTSNNHNCLEHACKGASQ